MRLPSWLTSTLLWIVAFALTAASAVYQKITGPSYPVRGVVRVAGQEIRFKLPRSHGGAGDAVVRIPTPDPAATAVMRWRRFRSRDPWMTRPLVRDKDALVARIPHQPPAGKVMYQITLRAPDGTEYPLTKEPVIIRFRGGVPAWILITHVLFIFSGMFLSLRTGFEALRPEGSVRGLAIATLVGLVVGGLVFGPLVQKYAFGAYWTGWPFGHDLTDNKIAVAIVFWVLALWRGWQPARRNAARRWALIASAVTLVVWLIPHSVLGSELDYTRIPSSAPAATSSAPANA